MLFGLLLFELNYIDFSDVFYFFFFPLVASVIKIWVYAIGSQKTSRGNTTAIPNFAVEYFEADTP